MGKIRAKQKSLILKPKTPWVPPGQTVTVGEYRIPDGMIYVGRGVKAVGGPGTEPALIDPSLPVGSKPSRPILFQGGWLAYDRMSPDLRATYLRWLADGRSAPDPEAGCLSLFFFGIERRLLFDAQISRVSDAEWLKLIAEVDRLLDLNRDCFWMYDHVGPFLVLARLLIGDYRTEPYETRLDVVGEDALWRVGPSLFAAAGRPLSAPWAFALWGSWEEARRGTAEHRCPDEFRELFQIRYREAFCDGGLHVKPGREPLILKYLPANFGFQKILFHEAHGIAEARLPRSHLHQLQKIADQVSAELDLFSRRAGRTRDTSSLAALALLPRELLQRRESEAAVRLGRWLDATLGTTGFAYVEWKEILEN